MKVNTLGIILIIVGGLGILAGSMMFGDIGVAAMIAGTVGVLAGWGFILVTKQ